ncbi:MAG: nucleotidyltransferase domain-containing protein [Bacillota bacterium]
MDNNVSLDMNLITKEFRLLLEILKKENDEINLGSRSELFSNIDWELFLQFTKHHRVYPLIFVTLKRIDEKLVPRHVIEALYQEYKKNTFQMLCLSREMERVSKLFSENQICLLFLKGPAIASDLYGDISLRTSKDLDMLIPLNDLDKAEKLLNGIGYERVLEPTVLNELKVRYHHITYYNAQRGIHIEIHWRLHPPPMKEPTFNELWKRKRTSMLTTHPIYFFGKEDLFLYLIAHGARHGWFRLRWLNDIDQMLRQELCMKKIYLLLKRHQYYHLGGQALILASKLLNSPINKEMKILTEGMRSKRLAKKALIYIQEKDGFLYPKDYLFSLKSNTQKLLFILTLFYPSSADAEILRLPKYFHFLYFPLRPFLCAWRMTRKRV